MGETKRVERDTKQHEADMSLTIDGTDQTAAQWAYERLLDVAEQEHRGRHDTWGAARDRAAVKLGIERSYAKRIWDRWQDMRDVSGTAIISIAARYERICERNNAAAHHDDLMRKAITNGRKTAINKKRG